MAGGFQPGVTFALVRDDKETLVFLSWSLGTFYIPIVLSGDPSLESYFLEAQSLTLNFEASLGQDEGTWDDIQSLKKALLCWHGRRLLLCPSLAS